jgi:small neutral amino acid transporter SnatA (MarC family)
MGNVQGAGGEEQNVEAAAPVAAPVAAEPTLGSLFAQLWEEMKKQKEFSATILIIIILLVQLFFWFYIYKR